MLKIDLLDVKILAYQIKHCFICSPVNAWITYIFVSGSLNTTKDFIVLK